MRTAGVGCVALMLGSATLAAEAGQSSLEAISRGLQQPTSLSLISPPVFVVPDETHRFGILTLASPNIGKGEFFKVSLPVGELATRVTGAISNALYQRRERKAREAVARDLREFLARRTAK
jgi:hypothetical protein